MLRLFRILSIITLATVVGRAVDTIAALPQHRKPAATRSASVSIPHAVTFREVAGRGLMVRTWVNGSGPFNFAIDTGAGATIISQRAAAAAHVARISERATSIAGLSGAETAAHHASVQTLAIGDADNYLPAKGEFLVTDALPSDLDGVLDPTEALSPLGYILDLPERELAAFDPQAEPLRKTDAPVDGAVVEWLRETHGRRPFVLLDNGDRALLDTGSQFGLAIRESNYENKPAIAGVRDIGGGRISSRRVTTSNIAIGTLTLRRIPTDLVSGAEADAPVLLGLAALRPFRLRFDPLHRLIEIAPGKLARN